MDYSNGGVFDLKKTISAILSQPGKNSVFDQLIIEMENYFSRPANSSAELRERENMRKKGDVWENFCREWLLAKGEYLYVWLWKDLPEQVRQDCNLNFKQDNGIDLVAYNTNGFSAIQCKYRQKKGNLEWKQLSTFMGLCSITGPWYQHIVMTNCPSINRPVQKGPKDKSICSQSFRGASRELWLKIAGIYQVNTIGNGGNNIQILPQKAPPLVFNFDHINIANSVVNNNGNNIDVKHLRELRLKKFC